MASKANTEDGSDGVSVPIPVDMVGSRQDLSPTRNFSIDTGVAPERSPAAVAASSRERDTTGASSIVEIEIAHADHPCKDSQRPPSLQSQPSPPSLQLPPGLSKNRQKKLAKRERARQQKLDRKAAEKAQRLQAAVAEGRDVEAERKFQEERTRSGDRRRRLDEIWESKRRVANTQTRFEICIDLGARRRRRRGRCGGHDPSDTIDNSSSTNTHHVVDSGETIGFATDGRRLRANFEEAMREREIASLAQQIRYCYSYNKKSPKPVFASVTGLTLSRRKELVVGDETNHDGALGLDFPTLRELLERETGFPEWNRFMFDCSEKPLEDYYGLQQQQQQQQLEESETATTTTPTTTTTTASAATATAPAATETASRETDEQHPKQTPKTMVYLTSDSPHTLERLEPNTVYVIGGIVDRNRLQRATLQRAQDELRVATAKLPLREYLQANRISMTTTKVLTVNHVFDILLKYQEYDQDWNRAFQAVLPSRKV